MACFIKGVSREAIKDLELGNPFLRMKLFCLTGVEINPLTLEDVPQRYRPYPGCLFVSDEGREGGSSGPYRIFLGRGDLSKTVIHFVGNSLFFKEKS